MAGLDPGIHHASQDSSEEMDCRGKPGNDEMVV
jgi:peptide/nickel transport system ATP-binding protein